MPFGGLLTVGLISAGTSLIGGAIQSHQQGKAVEAQKEAGDKALALQKDIYNQQQANEAPFRNNGAAAITTLGGLLGLPSSGGGGGTGQLPSTSLGGPEPNTPWGGTVMDDGQHGAISDPNKNPDASYGTHGDLMGPTSQAQRAAMPTATSYNSSQTYGSAPQATGGTMVTMQAPDGTRQQVPRDQASHYVQLGAKVIG